MSSPALLLHNLLDGRIALGIIIFVIFVYYILSTILPIDKIIGRIYPIFGALLLISAVGIGFRLIQTGAPIPEINLKNMHPDGAPIFPLLFLQLLVVLYLVFMLHNTYYFENDKQREKWSFYILWNDDCRRYYSNDLGSCMSLLMDIVD